MQITTTQKKAIDHYYKELDANQTHNHRYEMTVSLGIDRQRDRRYMKSKKLKKNWDDDLPDTSLWLPRTDHTQTLREAFYKRCKSAEERIILRAKHEREMNIDNFDSGIGVEDIIRDELKLLCPGRYSIRAGVIDDRFGSTAGDFEIIIFNDFWFPTVKSGAAQSSRRYHYPIEGVYAILE